MKTNLIVTVSRQYGSGGHEIGQKLAQRLGVPFYDRKWIAAEAKKRGVSVEAYEKEDQKAAGSMLYSLLMADCSFEHGVPTVNHVPVTDQLFRCQAQIIRDAAKQGPCVIVGRCADNILKEEKNLFSIFVAADKLSRMDRIVTKYGVGAEDAAWHLVGTDKERANFYHYYSEKEWGAAENYVLSINSSVFGIDGTVDWIADALTAYEERKRA